MEDRAEYSIDLESKVCKGCGQRFDGAASEDYCIFCEGGEGNEKIKE